MGKVFTFALALIFSGNGWAITDFKCQDECLKKGYLLKICQKQCTDSTLSDEIDRLIKEAEGEYAQSKAKSALRKANEKAESPSKKASEMWWASRAPDMTCKPSPNGMTLNEFTSAWDEAKTKYHISTETEKYGYYLLIIENESGEAGGLSIWSKTAADCTFGVDSAQLNIAKARADKAKAEAPDGMSSEKYLLRFRTEYNSESGKTLSEKEFA